MPFGTVVYCVMGYILLSLAVRVLINTCSVHLYKYVFITHTVMYMYVGMCLCVRTHISEYL
jgi:hypothetical protein